MSLEYIRGQEEAGFKVNDVVLVTRKAEGGEAGWMNGWAPNMTAHVGQELIVTTISGENGIGLSDGYAYPYYVLKKSKDFIMPDFVKVGAVFRNGNCFLIITQINMNDCSCREHDIRDSNHYNIHRSIYNLLKNYTLYEP